MGRSCVKKMRSPPNSTSSESCAKRPKPGRQVFRRLGRHLYFAEQLLQGFGEWNHRHYWPTKLSGRDVSPHVRAIAAVVQKLGEATQDVVWAHYGRRRGSIAEQARDIGMSLRTFQRHLAAARTAVAASLNIRT